MSINVNLGVCEKIESIITNISMKYSFQLFFRVIIRKSARSVGGGGRYSVISFSLK